MAYDNFNRDVVNVEKCLANLRSVLRHSGDVYHKHLQSRLALLIEQLKNETVPHEFYRAQGRVKELTNLIEELFPRNEA